MRALLLLLLAAPAAAGNVHAGGDALDYRAFLNPRRNSYGPSVSLRAWL